MGRDVERRDADISSCQQRRHAIVLDRTREVHIVETGCFCLNVDEFRSVANEHSRDVVLAVLPNLADRPREMDCPVPTPERSRKYGDSPTGPREGHAAGCAWVESHGIRAPLEPDDLRWIRFRRQHRHARRHDEICGIANGFAPTAHRFDEQSFVEESLLRAREIDHRRIDFQYGDSADGPTSGDAFTAEIVVALDDHLWLQRARDARHGTASHPTQS